MCRKHWPLVHWELRDWMMRYYRQNVPWGFQFQEFTAALARAVESLTPHKKRNKTEAPCET